MKDNLSYEIEVYKVLQECLDKKEVDKDSLKLIENSHKIRRKQLEKLKGGKN